MNKNEARFIFNTYYLFTHTLRQVVTNQGDLFDRNILVGLFFFRFNDVLHFQ